MMGRAGRLTAGVLLLSPVLAGAEVFDTFGFGPRAAAMAGAMTAEANDYSSVFYNPALLVHRKDANFGFSVNWYRPLTTVTQTDTNKTLDCAKCSPPDTVGYSLGLVGPLGGKVKNRVALGVGLYLPVQRLLHVEMPDPSTPYWYHYESHSEKIGVFLGVGVRITDWLTIGAGVQALADLVGTNAHVTVDLFSKQVLARELDAELQTRIGGVFGVHLQPIPKLRFGITYRMEVKLEVTIPATVDLQGVGTLDFVIHGFTHYQPHAVQFGAAWDVTDDFTLSLDGEWQHWSAAPSPYEDLKIGLSGAVLDGLGLGTALDIESPSQPPGFQDTFSGRLGGEYRVNKRFAARAGAYYRPTPVPLQNTAGTNILDGSSVGLTFGFGFNFDDPLEVFQAPVNIDLSGLAAFMLPRAAKKDSFDTVASYTYSANVVGVMAAVRYDW